MNIKKIFTSFLKGKNFITPEIVRYGKKGNFVYELSTGSGMMKSKTLYGLTILELNSDNTVKEKRNDLSKCCHSKAEAEKAIEKL